jgi:hypothetical protein
MSAEVLHNAPPAVSGPPASRPLRWASTAAVLAGMEAAVAAGEGMTGAHCIHELWMRGVPGLDIEAALERLWQRAAASIPDWLPMRHFDWLPLAYEVAARFQPRRRGRSNVYLVLLDYRDSRPEPYGVYVGETRYRPADRFDQHKAGIRAAGSVLRRGLEVLTGPAAHLQHISRADALDIEERLALALGAAGLFVQGGH